MGCCCACLKGGGSTTAESEMTSKSGSNAGAEKHMKVSRSMSAPTIELESNSMKVSGSGLALVGVTIEQDAAYWEWHIEIPDGSTREAMFGVATKKDRAFYRAMEESDGDESPQEKSGTALMKRLQVKDDDTVGVAVQHSDLPMIQFLINGEPMDQMNRFRGQVYPSIWLPEDNNNDESMKALLVLDENDFRHMSPHARFGPVIVARGII